ncbi:MAG: thioredoxin domain-containing protein [Patescibacteria group bacterium]|jgi:protein-disulfide isomerase
MDKHLTDKDTKEHWFTRLTSPRLSFWLGVVLGCLIITFAGVGFIGYLYADGKFFLEQPDLNINAVRKAVENPVEDLTTKKSDVSLGTMDYPYGYDQAELILVVYSDYECPICQLYYNNVQSFVATYPGRMRLVMKNFVLNQKHPKAQSAAQAAICAGQQGQYYGFADRLFADQNSLNEEAYLRYAAELGFNENEFTACLDDQTVTEKIYQDYQEALDLGVHGIPNTIIIYPDDTTQLIDGNVSKDFLASLLSDYL